MTICYFGIYDPEYSRNRVFIKGLRQNGVEVIECVSRLRGVAKYIELIKKHKKIRGTYDVMVVGYPGQQAVLLAKILTSKPIVLDALVPLYESLVYSRGQLKRLGLSAMYYWFLESLALRMADKVIVDTNAHRDYFVQTFRLNMDKFIRIFIGSDTDVFYPTRIHSSKFIVHFHGALSPLQGVEHIIGAAKILEHENIYFQIIGEGQSSGDIKRLLQRLDLKNVTLCGYVPHHQLTEHMGRASVSLGLFGTVEQARRAIPNKIYEALAARSPIITSSTPAVQELLTDTKNVLFCKAGSAEDLACAIRRMRDDSTMRATISQNGYTLFMSKLTPRSVGAELSTVLRAAVG